MSSKGDSSSAQHSFLDSSSPTNPYSTIRMALPNEAVVLEDVLNREASDETSITYFVKQEVSDEQQGVNFGAEDAEDEAVEVEGEEDPATSLEPPRIFAALIEALHDEGIEDVDWRTLCYVRPREKVVSLAVNYLITAVVNLVGCLEDLEGIDEDDIIELHETVGACVYGAFLNLKEPRPTGALPLPPGKKGKYGGITINPPGRDNQHNDGPAKHPNRLFYRAMAILAKMLKVSVLVVPPGFDTFRAKFFATYGADGDFALEWSSTEILVGFLSSFEPVWCAKLGAYCGNEDAILFAEYFTGQAAPAEENVDEAPAAKGDETDAEDDVDDVGADGSDDPLTRALGQVGLWTRAVVAAHDEGIKTLDEASHNFLRHADAFTKLVRPYLKPACFHDVQTNDDLAQVDPDDVVYLEDCRDAGCVYIEYLDLPNVRPTGCLLLPPGQRARYNGITIGPPGRASQHKRGHIDHLRRLHYRGTAIAKDSTIVVVLGIPDQSQLLRHFWACYGSEFAKEWNEGEFLVAFLSSFEPAHCASQGTYCGDEEHVAMKGFTGIAAAKDIIGLEVKALLRQLLAPVPGHAKSQGGEGFKCGCGHGRQQQSHDDCGGKQRR